MLANHNIISGIKMITWPQRFHQNRSPIAPATQVDPLQHAAWAPAVQCPFIANNEQCTRTKRQNMTFLLQLHFELSLSVSFFFSPLSLQAFYNKLSHQKETKTPASLQLLMNKTNGTNSGNYQGSKRINCAASHCRFA